MKNDAIYLQHILEAIGAIEFYLADIDYETFIGNTMAVDAVVRQLEIIGEASKNLSEKFTADNVESPLREAIEMRNFLIHEYFGVNTKIVWETYKNDLPILKEFVESRL